MTLGCFDLDKAIPSSLHRFHIERVASVHGHSVSISKGVFYLVEAAHSHPGDI